MRKRERRRSTTLSMTLLALIALLMVLVPGAMAVHTEGLFELDGNALAEPAVPGDDWSSVFTHTSSAFSTSFIGASVEAPANDTTYFTGGGSKDINDVPAWEWTPTDEAPDKDEITDAYAAAYALNGDTFLYFGMDRFATGGTADIGFWFFQSPVSTNPDGTFSGVHTVGDILVLSAFTNGGVISTIEVYRWVGGAEPLELVASGVDCADEPAGDDVCARVNGEPIPSPWPYTPKSGTANVIPANGFFEGGVNLSELLDTSDLPCFSSFLAETRTSSSLDARLKDFALGSVNSCGTVVINKVAVGGNDTFSYTGTGVGIDSAFTITTSGGTGSKTFATNVEPGQKTVTETALAGWTFKTLTCSDPDNGSSVAGTTATIDVDPGETVTCTYTNEKEAPALSIVKTSPTQSYDAVGDVITYQVVATNTGNTTLASVTITDANAVLGTCTPANGSSLAPGATLTCAATHTVTQADIEAGHYLNTACVDDGPGGAVQVCDDVDVPAEQNPALSIVKTSPTQSYDAVGDVITYQVVATNTGNTTLASVTITDANAVLGTCTPANGSSLAPGATLTCAATHTVTQADIDAGHYLNTACVDDGPGGAVQVCDDVDVPADQNPSILIVKSPDTQTIDDGGTANFTITVTNNGNVTLTAVNVADALSPDCVRTSAALGSNATLAPGASFNYSCSRAAVTASFTNSATATGTPPTGPDVTSTDTAEVIVNPPPPPPPPPAAPEHPSIAITKSPDLQTIASGGTATWTITVTNSGDVTLTNVRVTDAQAPGCARTQAEIAGLASMAPQASLEYSCSRANVTANFTNVAVATGTPPSGPDVTAEDDARVVILVPAITIVKTPDQQTVLQGATATFNIAVTNTGQVTLTNVRVTDAQAPGCARTQSDIAGLASMAPGATLSYSCTLANVQASFTNVAVATGTPPFGADVTDDDDAVVTVRIPHPAITIVKNPKAQTVSAGGTATFQITVTNTGDVELTNVTVADASAPDCNRSLGTLAPGQSAPTYTCTIANVTVAFDNVAIATGTPPVGGAVTATDTAPVTLTAPFTPPTKKPTQKPKVVTKKKPRVTG